MLTEEHRFDYVEENRTAVDHYVVAVYRTDRCFGGAEEGGWWFTEGELESVAGGFATEDEAIEFAADLRSDLELTRTKSWYDEGWAVDIIGLGRWELRDEVAESLCHDFDIDTADPANYVRRWDVPTHFPTHRPHYC